MHQAWDPDSESAAARFMKRLIRSRAVEFMHSPEYLKSLRFDYARATANQKRFGHIWEEYGTNIFQLIAEAHGEIWDAEDEEKHCSKKKDVAISQRESTRDDNLVAARKKGTRERFDELQGKSQAGVRLVEEEQGQGQEKARGEGFYRRAGGSCP